MLPRRPTQTGSIASADITKSNWDGGVVLNSSRYNVAHHSFTVSVALLAFLLIIAGGLVTSNSVMGGGVKFEHGYRMIAELVGLLTIVSVIWTWRVDKRRWMRALALGAVGGVVFQGILGELAVVNFLPPAISTAYAAVGQTVFCALAAIAVFTGRSWLVEPAQRITKKEARPMLRYCWMLIGLLYLQLILGAAFRHVWTKWGPTPAHRWPAQRIIHAFLYPHIVNALLVSFLVLYVSLRAIGKHSAIPHLRPPALLLLVLLITQVLLGFSVYFSRVVQGADQLQPTANLVITTVAHMGLGALILATTAVLTIQTYRYSGQPAQVLPFDRNRQVATA